MTSRKGENKRQSKMNEPQRDGEIEQSFKREKTRLRFLSFFKQLPPTLYLQGVKALAAVAEYCVKI
jgi:hypothetical protein